MISQQPTDPATEAFQHHLKVFGDAWMLIIISELLRDGGCRFNELQRRVCGISPVTLASRLKKLEHLGIIKRNAKLEDQLSVSYCMTDKGLAMEPVLREIRFYGQKYFDQPADCAEVAGRYQSQQKDQA